MLSRSLEIRRNDCYSAIGFQLRVQERGRSRGRRSGRWGGEGRTSSHIKLYRRPLALGGFVESSCILTHILARGQVTLLDYYKRGHRFGALAQLAHFLVPSLALESHPRQNENLSGLKAVTREGRSPVSIWNTLTPAVCVWVRVCMRARVCVRVQRPYDSADVRPAVKNLLCKGLSFFYIIIPKEEEEESERCSLSPSHS